MSKILHLATDEKFIDAANYIFEKAFPGLNSFLIIQPVSQPPLKYVTLQDNCIVMRGDDENLELIVEKANRAELIVLHGFDLYKARLFSRDNFKKKYLWLLWGAEAYNEQVMHKSFLGKATKKLSEKISAITLFDRIKNIYRSIRYKKNEKDKNIDIANCLNYITYMGILHKEEFLYFKQQKVINPHSLYIPFTYYPLEFIFKENTPTVKGKNILLGNSASFTNNHIEAIDLLAKILQQNQKVIVPLSYGNSRYAKAVINYGNTKIGAQIQPLQKFMPLDEYNEILAGCGIVVMNHYRQQAIGNVLASVYMGAKVFLNNTTVYQYLKRIGCYVFLIEKDLLNHHDLELLTQEQANHNRQILKNEISTSVVVKNLQNSLLGHFDMLNN